MGEICVASACTPRSSVWLATGVSTAQRFALDDAYVYWTDAAATVSRVPMSGSGPATAIWPGQSKPIGLAVDTDFVYWSNTLGGAIWRGAKDGSGSPALVTTATSPGDIALYGDSLYYTQAGSDVWVAPKAGGTGKVSATPKDNRGGVAGPGMLLSTPYGPFTRTYSSPQWFFYSVLGGWSGGYTLCLGCSNGAFVVDGAKLFYSELGCWFHAMDANTGASLGCSYSQVFPGAGLPITPLAANACGGYYADQTLWLARFGVQAAIPIAVIDAGVDRAAIAGGFLYFHSTTDGAIGKLP
jgi:hypothetical protein